MQLCNCVSINIKVFITQYQFHSHGVGESCHGSDNRKDCTLQLYFLSADARAYRPACSRSGGRSPVSLCLRAFIVL